MNQKKFKSYMRRISGRYAKGEEHIDYKKALGEARLQEIKKILKKQQSKPCARTHDKKNGKK